MTITFFGWLSIVFVAWGALSILVTPLIGQFLAGALREPRESANSSSQVLQNLDGLHLEAKLPPLRIQSESAPISD